MVKKLAAIFIVFFFFLTTTASIFAVENPLSVPNNKIGIHILFVHELPQAAQLINSNGGDWGYVIIPIQSGDRDLVKWQTFMDDAKKYHVIPIIRLATEGDYFNTKVWRKPNESDVLDFANFLNSLNWPTKNRYIVVFNEVNRSDEWGGLANPVEYAQLLSYTVSVFKSKSEDFFLIAAGLDNASANVYGMSFDSFDYLRMMNNAVPGIFNQIDGLGSHSYPNPAFAKPPSRQDQESIATFRFERQLVESLSNKPMPVFITETGWSKDAVSTQAAADYLKTAFETVWNDPGVVTITPFLLNSSAGPFTPFSFMDQNGQPNLEYATVFNLPKVKGAPFVAQPVSPAQPAVAVLAENTTKDFRKTPEILKPVQSSTLTVPLPIKVMLKWLMKL